MGWINDNDGYMGWIYVVLQTRWKVIIYWKWALADEWFIHFFYRCWWGYNLTPLYWILEGPRLAVILLNFFFLLNIIRVLVVKLRQSHTSEVEQVILRCFPSPFEGIYRIGWMYILPSLRNPLSSTAQHLVRTIEMEMRKWMKSLT